MTEPEHWPAPRATSPVDLTITLPGSKSLTNRALVLAAIADRPSVVRRALRSRDTALMASALTALGSAVDTSGDDWTVTPGSFDRDAEVDCGLAGTVMRFVPPVAGLSTGRVAFDGDAHMRKRPVGEVLTALRSLGRGRVGRVTRCRSRSTAPGPCAADGSSSTPPRPRSSSPRCCSPAPASTRAWTCGTRASRCPRSPTST